MYVLFALLVALAVYVLAALSLWRAGRGAGALAVMTAVSFGLFGALLIVFNLLSAGIGVDLGPGHPVSYAIPDDYLARGLAGLAVLAVYALAGLAPAFGLGLALRRR